MDTTDSPTFPTQKPPEAKPQPDNPSEQGDSDTEGDIESQGSSDVASVASDSELSDAEPQNPDSGSESEGEVDDVTTGLDPLQDVLNIGEEDDIESDEDEMEDDEYLKKFDRNVRSRFLEEYHPQALTHNYEEVLALAKVTRSPDGRVIDSLHRTIPILTKYEKTRILGQRASQLNAGAQPLVSVPTGVIQGAVIANLELRAKIIPFIIRRPLPNRGSEYWRVSDLELL